MKYLLLMLVREMMQLAFWTNCISNPVGYFLLLWVLLLRPKFGQQQLDNLRIIGGRNATAEEFPFFARVEIKNDTGEYEESSLCGGSIIHPKWVLTAGHCFTPNFKQLITLYIGMETEEQRHSIGIEVQAEAFFLHENYNHQTNQNDIALIKLCEPLKFSNRIAAIQLPSRKNEADAYLTGQVMGYGKTDQKSDYLSPQLMAVELEIFDNNEDICVKDPRFDPLTMICVGLKEGGKDSCYGDSGGPFVIKKINGEMVLVGIVSFATQGCAQPGLPGYYTRVSSFLSWINKTMTENQ